MEVNAHIAEVSGHVMSDQGVVLSWTWFDVFHPRDGCSVVQEKPDVLEMGVALEDVCAGAVEGSGCCNQFRIVYLVFWACVDGDILAESWVECRSCAGISVFKSGAISVYK
jgi:hypothetical protein